MRVKLLGDGVAYAPRGGFEAARTPDDSDSITLVISAPDEGKARRCWLLVADSERIELRDKDVRVADVVPKSFRLGQSTVAGQERWTASFEVRLMEIDALKRGWLIVAALLVALPPCPEQGHRWHNVHGDALGGSR